MAWIAGVALVSSVATENGPDARAAQAIAADPDAASESGPRPAVVADPPALLEAVRAIDAPVEPDGTSARIWDAIHELRERFPGTDPTPYRPLEGRLLELPLGESFPLSALCLIELPGRERRLRSEAEVALRRVVLDESAPATLRKIAVELLVERGDPESFGNLRAIKTALDKASDAGLRIACAHALWWPTRARYQLAPVLPLLDDPAFAIRAETALMLAETGEYNGDRDVGAKIDRILAWLELEPSERGRRAARLRSAARGERSIPRAEDDRRSAAEPPRPPFVGPFNPPNAGTDGMSIEDVFASFAAWLRSLHYAPSEIPEERLLRQALDALVRAVDPHASLLTSPGDTGESDVAPGRTIGLGVRLGRVRDGEPLVVIRPFYGGPAFAADASAEERLITGDRIIEINGLPTADRTLEEIQTLLADLDEGDTVFLRFARGLDEPRSLRLRYGSLEVPPIVAERVAPAIGWIRIRSFPAGASRAFEAAYDALAADGPPLEGLIVDVRDNPGGVLDEATSIVDLFVAGESEGRPIVSERRFDGRPPVEHLLSPGRKIDEPVIVIVDSATASAAEVLAGSLQAYHRAVVVGERTWGKGVAQDTFEVPPAVRHLVGGAARVRLPTRFLVLPNGLGFHRQAPGAPAMRGGIVPDVHVADDPSFTDERLLAAFYASETSAYLFEHRELIESLPEIARWRKESHPALDDLSCALIEKHGVRVDDDELLEVLKRLSWRHADDREGKRRSRAPDDDLPLERAIELLRG